MGKRFGNYPREFKYDTDFICVSSLYNRAIIFYKQNRDQRVR